MFRDLLEAVRSEVSGTRARDDVAAVSRFHRVQSSPGYREAADWLEGRLRDAGLAPERVEVPGDGRTRCLGILQPRGWECSHARAVLEDGGARETLAEYPREPLSLVLRSAPARGRFEVVDVGPGDRPGHYEGRDVRGRVVLASAPVRAVHRLAAVERGAAGILTDTRRLVPPARRAEDERDARNYTSFWWSEREPRGWGFVITPETADRLRARLAARAPLALAVEIESRDFEIAVPLVTARIGPAAAAEVLVTAHLCHPLPSANDNGSGVAAALETARVLAALERRGAWRPERAVRFLWMPELTGTQAWLAGDPERARRTVAALNLDMVGQDQEACGSTQLIEHPPCFAASFATELLARIRDRAIEPDGRFFGATPFTLTRIAEVPYSGGSDHACWIDPAIGVPCPMLIEWPDRFYHSSHDTVERTSPASLALAVRCAATYAGFLAAAGPAAVESLLGLVERGAERRLLEALESGTPAEGGARERRRGEAAIRSLARLGAGAEAIEAAARGFLDFAGRHGVAAPADPAGGPVWSRRISGALDFSPPLWPGYDALGAAGQVELLRRLEGIPGGTTTLDVAWFACDGRRSLAEIVALVRLETGLDVAADSAAGGLGAFFEIAEKLGLAERRA